MNKKKTEIKKKYLGVVVLVVIALEQAHGACDQPERPSCEAARASCCVTRLQVLLGH